MCRYVRCNRRTIDVVRVDVSDTSFAILATNHHIVVDAYDISVGPHISVINDDAIF